MIVYLSELLLSSVMFMHGHYLLIQWFADAIFTKTGGVLISMKNFAASKTA